MSKKALVTGANGMLADALCPLLEENGYKVYPTDVVSGNGISGLDIRKLEQVEAAIETFKPDIVFHLAAETNVDKCELKPEHAYQTNAKGTENIAIACRRLDIPLVYISTGAIFDGEKEGGYTEDDKPNPISVYGRSKLEGENAVRLLLTKYYIVRAGWMIGGYTKDKKFVWKIIQLLKTKSEIPVVTDKTGSPTFINDFVKNMLAIVPNGEYGIYHCVNKGACTRFEIAKKIAEYMNKKDVIIKPVTSECFPLPAPRGRSEALINKRLASAGMDAMRPWQEALKEYIERIP